MKSFSINQTVKVNLPGENKTRKGIIICKCELPVNHWALVLVDKKSTETLINIVPENFIEPHIDICWKCKRKLNSSEHITCEYCHWIKCPDPNCLSCQRPECESDGITIKIFKEIQECSTCKKKIHISELVQLGDEHLCHKCLDDLL
ncbi:MAG: hypothetical protein ACOYJ1_04735 [Peptococcales bacterium]|jgi:DNA-directed RNA polymerase subunit RPC12/RpoP